MNYSCRRIIRKDYHTRGLIRISSLADIVSSYIDFLLTELLKRVTRSAENVENSLRQVTLWTFATWPTEHVLRKEMEDTIILLYHTELLCWMLQNICLHFLSNKDCWIFPSISNCCYGESRYCTDWLFR